MRPLIGWHVGNDTGIQPQDWELMHVVEPELLVVLPSTDVNQQPVSPQDIGKVLERWPKCHIFLRPYIPAHFWSVGTNKDKLVDTCASMLTEYHFIPDGQRHLQIGNEPNMPWQGSYEGWEGFGPTVRDMQRFSEWFTYVLPRVKQVDPFCLIGSPPLTIGNSDAWFRGDKVEDYWMHSPQGCRTNLDELAFEAARAEGQAVQVWDMADEQYDHTYWHYGPEAYSEGFYGQRHRLKQAWYKRDKPLWILEAGAPNKHFADQPWWPNTVVPWFKASDNVRGAALWLMGNNPKWGGRMWRANMPAVEALAEYQAAETPGEGSLSLRLAIYRQAQATVIPYNPGAALQKAGDARQLAAVSPESILSHAGATYVMQVFRSSTKHGVQYVAYTEVGHYKPDEIQWIEWTDNAKEALHALGD